MDKDTAVRLAQESFDDLSIATVNMRSKARLWAGMGNIYEVECPSSVQKTLIIKYIHPRFAKNAKLSLGDQRKWDSYHVEANFYEHHAEHLIKMGVPLPPPYKVERHDTTIIICMGALPEADYYSNQNEGVMKWLARFHAATWNKSSEGAVQPVGSYWHLDTRPSEWEDIPRNGWEGRLKLAARAIDNRLKRDPLQCWVHGDTKDANILLAENGADIAFCDFQYCGAGPPSKDLAYFLCTNMVSDAEERKELVDLYFEELCQHLRENPSVTEKQMPTRQQLDDSLELAFCDFCRFMAGWGYWGYDLSKQVKKTLDKIDGGKKLRSESDYEKAMERVFG